MLKPNIRTKVEDLLSRISDPVLRAVIGTIIAERNRCRSENRILKAQSDIIVDRRSVQPREAASVEAIPSLPGLLNDLEAEALMYAVSPAMLSENGWTASASGRVKNEVGRTVLKTGFLTAIKKIVATNQD